MEQTNVTVARTEIVVMPDGRTYFVESEKSAGTYYRTTVDAICSCPDYKFRHSTCKHIRKVFEEIVNK